MTADIAATARVLGLALATLGLVAVQPASATASPGAPAQSDPEEPWVTRTVLWAPPAQNTGAPVLLDINDQGQVVGHDAEYRTPLLWSGGDVAQLLPSAPPGETALARAHATFINDRGQVVIERGGTSALLWEDGSVVELPGSHPDAFDLNESGQVLLSNPDPPSAGGGGAAVWTDGQLTTIPVPRDAQRLEVNDLSESGQVVGNTYFWQTIIPGVPPIGYGRIRPFIWRDGSMTRLDTGATARHVNAAGQITIAPSTGSPWPENEGWVWRNGSIQPLGFHPADINDRGQVVGNSDAGAHLWHNGQATDLGSLGGGETWALGLNERGQVIGWSRTGGGEIHGFAWTSGHMLDLGPAANEGDVRARFPPVDINDQGQVIGYDAGELAVEDDVRAILWQVHDPGLEEPGGPTDPPDPACVSATNAAHVEAGRARSWLLFAWAVGSDQYLGPTSQTTTLRETAPGRWELVASC